MAANTEVQQHPKAADSHVGKASDTHALQQSSKSASEKMLSETGNQRVATAKPQEGSDASSTAKKHLPETAIDFSSAKNKAEKPGNADMSVPKDAQDHTTVKSPDGKIDSFKDKSGNAVDIHHNDKHPDRDFKMETRPDGSTKRTGADGTTYEHTPGKGADYKDVSTGPKPNDNFTSERKGDIVTKTNVDAKTGVIHESGKDMKDPQYNYEKTTQKNGDFKTTYKNGAEVSQKDGTHFVSDGKGNTTTTKSNGDVTTTREGGAKTEAHTSANGKRLEVGTGTKPGDNYVANTDINGNRFQTTDYGDGHTKTSYTSKTDSTKNYTNEKFANGAHNETDRDGTMSTDADGNKTYTTSENRTIKPEDVGAYKAGQQKVVDGAVATVHNDGNATEKFDSEVKGAVAGLPKDVQKLMADKKLSIQESDSAAKIVPDMKDQKMSGYSDTQGQTIGEGGAFYMGNKNMIAMPDRPAKRTDGPIEAQDPSGTARHEIGHFVDKEKGQNGAKVSDSPAFKAAYDRDTANWTPEQKKTYEHFIGQNGRAEAFGELSGQRWGGRNAETDAGRGSTIDQVMPETSKLVNQFYDEGMTTDGWPQR